MEKISTSGEITRDGQYLIPGVYPGMSQTLPDKGGAGLPGPGTDSISEALKSKSKRRYWRVSVFERELVVSNQYEKPAGVKLSGSAVDQEAPPVRTAGDIQSFSSKSRRRLFKLFNRIQVKVIGRPVFITLTARPDLITPQDFQKAFHQSMKPALRKMLPGSMAVWRLEPHRSGKPHYHVMFWSGNPDVNIESEYWKRKIRRAWRAAIGDNSRAAELYGCKIMNVSDVDHMFAYLSKYLAKEDDTAGQLITGRRWGQLGELPAAPITEVWLSRSDVDQLWQLAKAYLLERGKERLVEIIEEYTGTGWSIWMQLDEMIEFLNEIWCKGAAREIENYRDPP